MRRSLCFALVFALVPHVAPVWAQSNDFLLSQVEMHVAPQFVTQVVPKVMLSTAQAAGNGSAEVLRGSLSAMEVSCRIEVKRVEPVTGGMVIVLRGTGRVADVSIKLSGVAADELALTAGTAIDIVSISTGFVLSHAGEVITFVPNELGKSLYHPA